MARPLRIEYPGAFYHVTSRGNERKDIFRSQRDREKFLEYLSSATSRYSACVHVYCLMSNHYHLLMETPEGNLSQIMRHINGAYTTYFNVKRQRSGHLLQGRYKAILVEADEYAKVLSRYIHLNPVAARMVEHPGEYPWSSYSDYVGAREAPVWLERGLVLTGFGKSQGETERVYREFVEGALGRELPNPLEQVVGSTLLGGEGFVSWAVERFVKGRGEDRDVPALRELAGRPTIDAVRQAAERQWENDPGRARQLGMYLCHCYGGRKLSEIASEYGVGESAVTQASRRVRARLLESTALLREVGHVKETLGVSDV